MNHHNRVLIVDDMHESIIPLLKDSGYDPVYMPVIDRQGILEIVHNFSGLIIRSKTSVDKELIDKAKNLKFVARAGSGMDKLDVGYLKEKEILAINAPEGNRDSLGEQALGMLLSILHRIQYSYGEVKKGIWDRERNRGIELYGKVVGIYGVGNMGKSFAKKLIGLGCKVIGYDKYRVGFSDAFIKEVSLEEFKEKAEIMSIHIPLNDETKYLFNKGFLQEFSNLRVLINTSRGEVLETKALVELLESNELYGAALDVLENEKPSTYSEEDRALVERLTQQQNVIITPHVGGWTYESYARINEILAEKPSKAFAN